MGMAFVSLLVIGGTTRGAQSASTATSGTRPIPPLPPTLVLEGAAQPFLFEMVASHALQARPPSDPFIAGQSTTRTGGYEAGMETDRLPAFLNDIAFEPDGSRPQLPPSRTLPAARAD
jgi:hypothetical protein